MASRAKYWLAVSLAALALLLDQLTKYFFQHNPDWQFIVWKPALFLQFTANPKIAFGLPINSVIFIIFLIVILAILGYLLWRTYNEKELVQFCLVLFILVGAVGNIIDRLVYGYVVDFIRVPFWSIFNIADICIVVAVVVWMGYLFFYESRKKVPKKS